MQFWGQKTFPQGFGISFSNIEQYNISCFNSQRKPPFPVNTYKPYTFDDLSTAFLQQTLAAVHAQSLPRKAVESAWP